MDKPFEVCFLHSIFLLHENDFKSVYFVEAYRQIFAGGVETTVMIATGEDEVIQTMCKDNMQIIYDE